MRKNLEKYKTKAVECWPLMKEIRRKHFRHTWAAQEKGELVIMGIFEWFLALPAGFGDYANPSYGPYYTVILRDKLKTIECYDVAESRGIRRDICPSMRLHLGQLYMGLSQKGPTGVNIKPDFILQPATCYSMSKTGQIVSEKLDIPFRNLEFPRKSSPNTLAYLIREFDNAIEWMIEQTGRVYDDDKLIKAVENEWEASVLWAKIAELNKTVPSPLDFKMLWSLKIPNLTTRHMDETVQFYRILYDEVKDRISEGISANEYQTARLFHMFLPPFYATGIMKEPLKYGASFIGGDAAFSLMGAWDVQEDGTWMVSKTPKERGIVLDTREKALEALADLYMNHCPVNRATVIQYTRKELVKLVNDWHVDGVVIGLDKGCKTLSANQEEQAIEFKAAGIPRMTYEGSHADFRDFDEHVTLQRMDVFLEGLGLTELQNV